MTSYPCDDTDLNCADHSYECPALYNGGCCRFGLVCALDRCLVDDNAPQNQDEVDDYYGYDDQNGGINEDTKDDWINDGDRLGDEESTAIKGALTTLFQDVYTSTIRNENTTFRSIITVDVNPSSLQSQLSSSFPVVSNATTTQSATDTGSSSNGVSGVSRIGLMTVAFSFQLLLSL